MPTNSQNWTTGDPITADRLNDINQDLDLKLDIAGGLRTSLGNNRVLITNGTGQETTLTGSVGEVVGFGAGGVVQAVQPLNITGLPSKTTPVGADQLIISDSQSGWTNKRIDIASLLSPFGNGSDWDVTISVNTTLVRDMYYRNLTINSTIALNPNGYRIYVADTLTNNGIIRRNGNTWSNGFTGTSGTPWGATGILLNQWSLNAEVLWGDGAAVGASSSSVVWNPWFASNPSYTNINWVSWGTGGLAGGAGGTATRGALYNVALPTDVVISQIFNPASFTVTATQYKWPASSWGGGSYGNGGASSSWGGSGGNGGLIWISARTLNNTSGSIQSQGGNGWDGGYVFNYSSGGGGGGWQGGVILLIYKTLTSIGTTSVTGGTWWLRGGWPWAVPWTSSNGANGNDWVVIQIPITL